MLFFLDDVGLHVVIVVGDVKDAELGFLWAAFAADADVGAPTHIALDGFGGAGGRAEGAEGGAAFGGGSFAHEGRDVKVAGPGGLGGDGGETEEQGRERGKMGELAHSGD